MKDAKATIRTIILIALIVVALTVLISAVMYFMGYPVYLLSWTDLRIGYIGFHDPFQVATTKYYDAMDLFLKPFVPEIPMYYSISSQPEIKDGFQEQYDERERYYESFYKEVVRYLNYNDFTDELNNFEHLYQEAVQGDKNSKSQWEKPKMYRRWTLSSIQKDMAKIKLAIKAVQKYKGNENPLITEEDKAILKDVIVMTWRL